MARMNPGAAIIQSFITPVVLISACGLLLLTFANRLAIIVGRLRAFNKEKSDLQSELSGKAVTGASPVNAWKKKRLGIIDRQRIIIIRRANLM